MAALPSFTFFTLVSLFHFAQFLVSPALGQSITLLNNCNIPVFASSTPASYFSGSQVLAGSNANINTGGFAQGGFQLAFSTGCTDDTNCATGPNGTAPLYTAAFFQAGSSSDSIMYNINTFEGFNVGLKVEGTQNPSSCPAFSCDGLGVNCPVPGPSASCFSPCCLSAESCAAGAPICTIPGAHDSYFASQCPNAQSHLDYNSTMLPLTQTTCNGDITVTICPGSSSHFTLAEIRAGDFQDPSATASSSIPSGSATSSSSTSTPQTPHANAGIIAGAVISALVGVSAIAVIVYLLFWRRRRALQANGPTFTMDEERKVGGDMGMEPAAAPFHLRWGTNGNDDRVARPYVPPAPAAGPLRVDTTMHVQPTYGPITSVTEFQEGPSAGAGMSRTMTTSSAAQTPLAPRPRDREKMMLQRLDTQSGLGARVPGAPSASEGSSQPYSGHPFSNYPLSSIPSSMPSASAVSPPTTSWTAHGTVGVSRDSVAGAEPEVPPPLYEEVGSGRF